MKITLKAWAIVGLMAFTFMLAVRWIAAKAKLTGLQAAVANA